MKTRFFALLFLLCGTGALSAQQRIEQLVVRAENDPNVDTSVVINRNRESGETQRTVKTVTIRDNRALVSEFRTAFDRDRDDAYQITESTENGVVSKRYRFRSDGREIFCTLRLDSDSKAKVTYTDRDADVPSIQFYLHGAGSSLDTAALRLKMEEFGQNMENWRLEYGPQLEDLSRRMEIWGKEFGRKMEEAAKQVEIRVNGEIVKPRDEPM